VRSDSQPIRAAFASRSVALTREYITRIGGAPQLPPRSRACLRMIPPNHRFAPRLPTALEPSENGPKSGLPLRKRRIPGAPSEYRALPGARSRRHAPSAPVPSARATVPRFIARGRDPPHPKRKRRRGGPHTPRTPALGLLQLHAVGQPLPRLHQSEAPGEPLAVLLRPRSACSRQRRLHADTSSTSCA
jgi:hypothetical protein